MVRVARFRGLSDRAQRANQGQSSPSPVDSQLKSGRADDQGWVVRWATYSENGFEEGVSLTAADELSRWQKYAWGVSEIVFYPIKLWFKKGIFTPLFKGLISSNISTHSKWGIMAYMFSYYGQWSFYEQRECASMDQG
jgi:hypothetical protein